MKISITGHTAGIGLEISRWLSQKGHEVSGFSRSTGHDISQDSVLDEIVQSAAESDIFFNNATHDFQQTKLLFMLHEAWAGQQRTIVNISSAYTQRWDHSHRSPMYWTTKISLNEACRFLWNKQAWPRIVLATPCVTDTARAAWVKHPYKVNPADMADMICSAVLEKRCRIQEIAFEAHPANYK